MIERSSPMQRLPRTWCESDPWWPFYQSFRAIAKKHLQDRGDSDTGQDAVDALIYKNGLEIFGRLRKLCTRDIETRHLI